MEMIGTKPPLKDMDEVKKLGGVTHGATRACIFCNDDDNVTLADATKQGMHTANN
jgi:hypothetical protein